MSTRTARTHAAILEAAWKRLSTPGDRARLEDVAADAGVTRQTVYLHFGTRAALLIALVEHMDRELGLAREVTAIRACADPEEALLRNVALTARYQPKIHGVAMALVQLAPDDADARAALADRMSLRRAGLVAIVTRLRRARRLVESWSPSQVADALLDAGGPSSYQHLVVERGWSTKQFERWLVHVARSFVRRAPR